MTTKTRKTYTEEFKAAAVKLVAEGKQSAPEASKSLGIGESTLYKWIDQLKPMGEKDSKSIKVNDELIRLRGEVVELKKKLALAEAHRETAKKSGGMLRCPNAMKYAWIKVQHHQHAFNVNAMCEMPGVMPTGHKCEAGITRGKIARNLPVTKKISDWASWLKNHVMKAVIPTAENESKMM
ncbi:transposase [Methylovulum miyakonense]|uniref:transposase n=1 Tax=Methylovulum miyakonense TaxID=645578 RepID=UPI00037DF3C3|nr:transposase [Methylovulum miyakonense]